VCRICDILKAFSVQIEMGVPTRVYSVSLGGFDTHSAERATQQRLLGELDAALTGFSRRLIASTEPALERDTRRER